MAASRRRGFAQRAQQLGAEVLWSGAGDWTAASGYAETVRLLDDDVAATAIAAGNDSMAVGALAALSDRGVDVPGSVSVIGTDDIPEAEYHRPGLSTVAIDFEGEGFALVEELLVASGDLAPGDSEGSMRPPRVKHRASSSPANAPR